MLVRTLIACLLLTAGTARAGDFATLETLGFSPEGNVFAFEQHGIQDGSGFPYSEIFFVDLDRDDFVAGSPIRIRLDDESADLADARQAAASQAAKLLEEHGPFKPGLVVAANLPTHLNTTPDLIRFLPRAVEPTPDTPIVLKLETFPLETQEHCTAFGHEISGFRLIQELDGENRVLFEDETIPDSRRCPYDYTLAQVQVHGTMPGEWRAVVLIGVRSVGFEGPDMRYIALPVPLPDES
ncbi:DUF2259 domain-containing protein [Aureimonas fodinaquatilis]|uniref:DUF2259 domain-containing protein n=1 Tax=Aureimonas fodinaquatilis TaxID=2565783 RepID=A0A5B0DYW7_9HYPH|nr:DUF2259 domain-containing protein [Aureimonas fodinaquatilis]KAA0970740.1 DUF2259 domain-containing protein [Aureimonas fodinaquatilis]